MRRITWSSPAALFVAGLCLAGLDVGLHGQDEPSPDADEAIDEDEVFAYEQEEELAARQGIAGFFDRSADNISSQLRTEWTRLGGFVRADPITQLGTQWQEFNEDLLFTKRLNLGLAYTALWQGATEANGSKTAAGGDFDFFGTWHLFGQEGRSAGVFGFATEQRHNFGGIPPSDLNKSVGSVLRTTSGFNTFDFTLRQLWWEQLAADGHVLMRAGKIQMSDFFHTGRFRSANFFFLNEALSGSPAVAFPAAGPGAVLFGFPNESYYLAVGAGAADPNFTTSGFSGLTDGELFGAFEFGVLSNFEGYGPGTYRFTFWGTEGVAGAGGASGAGFAMSFDQQMGPITPFLRYSYSNHSGLTRIRQVASAGFGIQNPLGNEGDVFGVGLAWARPDAAQANDEYIVETFYRIQVTPTLQFTPDVQLIINPSSSTHDVVGVLGLRFRIQY